MKIKKCQKIQNKSFKVESIVRDSNFELRKQYSLISEIL